MPSALPRRIRSGSGQLHTQTLETVVSVPEKKAVQRTRRGIAATGAGCRTKQEVTRQMGNIIGYPLGWIMWLLYQVVKNYGVALILFTLVMKLLLFPLSVKQQKSTAKMSIMAPKQQELQKKYGNNKEKLNEEMMKLYQEEKYSPLSGCLPMLLQFVVLFGLIDVIYNPLEHILRFSNDIITQASEIVKGMADTVSAQATASQQLAIIAAVKADPAAFTAMGTEFIEKVSSINLNFLGLNLGEMPSWSWPIILVPLLSGITSLGYTVYSSYINKQNNTTPDSGSGGGMMKGMMYIMPVFSVFFAMQVPAGVGIYWSISNILSFIQTLYLNHKYNPKEMIEAMQAEEEAKKREKKESRKEMQEKKEQGEEIAPELEQKALSAKEINRRKLAAARRRDAEKYGEEYVEVTDDDLM